MPRGPGNLGQRERKRLAKMRVNLAEIEALGSIVTFCHSDGTVGVNMNNRKRTKFNGLTLLVQLVR